MEGPRGGRYIKNIPGRGYCFVGKILSEEMQPAAIAQPNRPRPTRHTSFPPPLLRIIGRDQTIADISDRVLGNRFVTLVGTGGIGKTSVAVAVGHKLMSHFSGNVAFIDFGSILDPKLVPDLLSSSLGLTNYGADAASSLLSRLDGERFLLVLDNCEHVVESAADLAEKLFLGAPNIYVLATSREPLRAEGEQVYRIEPLESPSSKAQLTASETVKFSAVQLFIERATASGMVLDLSDASASTIAKICRRLDGVALAIEVAASRAHAHGIDNTAELIENRFKLQWRGRRTALPRHQTLHSLVDWSYSRLDVHEQWLLRQLSIFVGPFDLEAAISLPTELEEEQARIAETLASLVDKSLVATVRDRAPFGYRLFESTRTYGLVKLVESSESDAVARRHALFYSQKMESLGKDSQSFPRDRQSNKALDYLSNVRSALQWCFSENGDATLGIRLAAAAVPHLIHLSLFPECMHWSEQAILRLPDDCRGTETEMDLQESFAISLMTAKGSGEEVLSAVTRGLALAEKRNDDQRRLRMLVGLNIVLMRMGDFPASLAMGEKCRLHAIAIDDTAALIMSELMVATACHLCGNQLEAHLHCDAGIKLAELHPGLTSEYFGYDHEVRGLVTFSRVLWLRGSPDKAIQVADQAIRLAEERDQPTTICITFIYLAQVFLWCGQVEAATRLADKLIDVATRHLMHAYRAVGVGVKGQCLISSGQAGLGLELIDDALRILGLEQHHAQTTTFLTAKAEALLDLGLPESASIAIDQAENRAELVGNTFDMPQILKVKASVMVAMADPKKAENLLRKSISNAKAQSSNSWGLRSTVSLAGLLSADNRRIEAYELLSAKFGAFTEGFGTADLIEAKAALDQLADRMDTA
jgi:predicted ATPase